MNTLEFVSAIKQVVCKSAVTGTIEVLQRPPGRRPDPDLLGLSKWFNGLNSADQSTVGKIIDLAANQATYNFCLVLDGLLAIEPVGNKGKIELVHNDHGSRTILNDDNGAQLTDLYKMT